MLREEKVILILPFFFFSLLLVSCRTLNNPEVMAGSEEDPAVTEHETDPDIHLSPSVKEGMVEKGSAFEAESEMGEEPAFLYPGHTLTELKRRIEQLERSRLQQQRHRETIDPARQRMMLEVEESMRLPENYGRTIRIAATEDSIATPPGPMEEVIEREISMRLRDAGLEELILALSEIEGLNIIADQALAIDRRITVNFTDVPLRELLQYVARNMGIDFQIGRNVVWITESILPGSGPKLETRIFNLRKGFIPGRQEEGMEAASIAFGDDGDEDIELFNALEELLLENSPEGSVLRLFKNRHLLLLRNTPENIRLAERIISHFDVVPRQVLIEARFLTVSQRDLNQLGVDIQQIEMTRDDQVAIQSLLYSSIFPAFPDEAESPSLAVSGILGNHEYQATLRALHKLTDAETMSAPRLTLLNNQTAQIRRGSNFYYWEEWELVTATVIADGTPVDDVSRHAIQPVGRPTEIEQGITLRVKVSVGDDGKTVIMSLAPSIKNVDQLNFYGAGSFRSVSRRDPRPDGVFENEDEMVQSVGYFLPEVSESSVNTAVAVKSGETVVLGGILENRVQEELHKVPLLGDLPLLGGLFRRTRISREPRHLLIFVTARVISPSGEYVEVGDL